MTTTSVESVLDTYPHYAADYQAQPDDGPQRLRALRSRGWDAFARLGLPTARRGNEPWKYTNVAPIAREAFAHPAALSARDAQVTLQDVRDAAPWQADWHTVVLVDGELAPDLSSLDENSAVTSSLRAASGSPSGLGQVLGTLADPDEDGFAALNTAFLQDGIGVEVARGSDAGVINIVYLTTGHQQPRVTHPRLAIHAGENSRVTVIETFAGPEATRYFTNAVMETSVEEGAGVEHYRLLLEGDQAYHVGVSRVLLHKDATFSSVAVARGAALGRNDFGVTMAGTGANCTLNGLYLTSGTQHIDNYLNIDHAQPYGTSRLFYKGILDGRSRAVFGGNVTVRKHAQKTDAQQTDKNLLLSQEAEVDSKPSLLIYADDVKCGHGATAGNIDADTVFYMRSRGLDLPTASRILIHAFASEIIDTVALEPLREYLDVKFQDALPSADIVLPIGGQQ